MYLHKDRELFQEAVYSTSAMFHIPVPVAEKDYYVTMILKLLSEKAQGCVLKGGTSISKCHHAINRFSEDIDITFTDKLTQGQRKRLKNDVIDSISNELELPIHEVRIIREQMSICPSAQKGVSIPVLLERIIKEDVYRNDYNDITAYFQNEQIGYDVAIESLKQIADGDMFRDEEFE